MNNSSKPIDHDTNTTERNTLKILREYRRALSRFENGGNKDVFEKFQHHVRELILENMGCNMTDIETLLQWSWIPRDEHGYRIVDQPLRVPLPKVMLTDTFFARFH